MPVFARSIFNPLILASDLCLSIPPIPYCLCLCDFASMIWYLPQCCFSSMLYLYDIAYNPANESIETAGYKIFRSSLT